MCENFEGSLKSFCTFFPTCILFILWSLQICYFSEWSSCFSKHFAQQSTSILRASEYKGLAVCEASYATRPSLCHDLWIFSFLLPYLWVQPVQNLKSSSLNCRLGCRESSSSALEGWSLYGQQYDGVRCCATKEQPVTVFLSVLCKRVITVCFTVCWNTMHLWLWSHICALLIGNAYR